MSEFGDRIKKGLDYLKSLYGDEAVENAIKIAQGFRVETPAWGYWIGFGGISDRFAADENYNPLGAARNNEEIAEDAALVHKLTKSAPFVGAHVLWQLTKDGKEPDMGAAKEFHQQLTQRGLGGIGSISPTYFIGPGGKNSFTAIRLNNRRVYIDQTVEAAKIANELKTNLLTLWFPDGTNLPGQEELQDKQKAMRNNIIESVEGMPPRYKRPLNILVEYKVFEPGTYSTTISNPMTALLLSQAITKVGANGGVNGGVLVDLGHHPHGVNIEGIVADLIDNHIRGGFHFNTRYAADDDHSVEPNAQMARIFHELLYGNVVYNPDPDKNWVYALDQMPRAEQRIPAILKSIEALKISIARAALYPFRDIIKYQTDSDLVEANRAQESALLLADTRPIMWEAYLRAGLHPDPFTAYKESGCQQKVMTERNKPLT